MTPTMWEPQPRLTLAEAESGGKDAVRCVYACISALGRYVNFCEMDWIVGKFGRGPRSKKICTCRAFDAGDYRRDNSTGILRL